MAYDSVSIIAGAAAVPASFGSHVPQQQRISEEPQPANYPGRANRPWDKPGRAQYIGHPICTAEITDENQFTPESYFAVSRDYQAMGLVDLSIQGTFTSTVTLQRSFDDGTTWQDVETFTAAVEKNFYIPSQATKWRLGVKEGDFTSGPLTVRLSQV